MLISKVGTVLLSSIQKGVRQAAKVAQPVCRGATTASKQADTFVHFDDFFYNIVAKEPLAKLGLDGHPQINQLLASHENLARNAWELQTFVENIEKIGNPKKIKKLLEIFNFKDNTRQEYLNFETILKIASEYPEIFDKCLKLKKINSFMFKQYMEMFKNSDGTLKITDEIFNAYLKLEKTNPDVVAPYSLRSINGYLNKFGNDTEFVKLVLEKLSKVKDKNMTFSNIFASIKEHNVDYAKAILTSEKEITIKSLIKIDLSKDFKSFEKDVDEIFEPLYRQLVDRYGMASFDAYHNAKNILELKLKNPEQFKKITDLNLLSLVTEGKIEPAILQSFRKNDSTLIPEVIADIKKLQNGENLVKKCNSISEAIKQTNAGDVMSINGQMFINNNGKLIPWQMTEETFNELFPLVNRFATAQAKNDCYFISVINSLYQNPKTRGAYYQLFKQKGNDIYVTIPAYSDFGGTIKFPMGQISTDTQHMYSASGAKHVQMVEQAYSRVALREGHQVPNFDNPLTTTNLEYLNDRIAGGHSQDVLREFKPILANKNKGVAHYPFLLAKDKGEKAKYIISTYGNNPRYIVSESTMTSGGGHARSIKGYNPDTQMVTICDPNSSWQSEELPLDEVSKNIMGLTITRVG